MVERYEIKPIFAGWFHAAQTGARLFYFEPSRGYCFRFGKNPVFSFILIDEPAIADCRLSRLSFPKLSRFVASISLWTAMAQA